MLFSYKMNGVLQADDLEALWYDALTTADRSGAEVNADGVYRMLIANRETFDGVPRHVADACWEAAIRKHPQPKRGPNIKGHSEYKRRIKEWKDKTMAKITAASCRARERLQLQRDARAAKVRVKEAEKAEEFAAGEWRLLDDCVDDWEDLVPVEEAAKLSNVSKGLKFTRPEPVDADLPHGHPILAMSRSNADASTRLRGLTKMLAALDAQAFKPVVYDVGSGSSGIKQVARIMDSVERATDVFWHCSFPIATSADLGRDSLLLGQQLGSQALIDRINWMDETGVPALGRINVCRHKASECQCLAAYGSKFVMSIHSSYYFTDCDWQNLFRYTDQVWMGLHLPERIGCGVPSKDPEFVWQRVEHARNLSWWDRFMSKTRTWLTGREELVFEPLRANGTTYIQPNPRHDFDTGGFHMAPPAWNNLCDSFTATDTRVLAVVGATLTGCALGLTTAVETLFGAIAGRQMSTRKVWSRIALAIMLEMPYHIIRAREVFRHSPVPPNGAHYTVTLINGRALTVEGENLSYTCAFKRVPLSRLEPRLFTSNAVKLPLARELAAMAALGRGKGEEKLRDAAVARAFRDGLTPLQVKQTLEASRTMLREVSENVKSLQPQWSTSSLVQKAPSCVLGGAVTSILMVNGTDCIAKLLSDCAGLRLHLACVAANTCLRKWIPSTQYLIAGRYALTREQVAQLCSELSMLMGQLSPLVREWLLMPSLRGTSPPQLM